MGNADIFDFKINETHKLILINKIGEKSPSSFLLDLKNNTKATFENFGKEYTISDISPEGKYVAIIPDTFDKKDRIFRILNVETKEAVFETNQYFAYEILFSPMPNLIVCRADIKNKAKVFVFDISKNEIVYQFPRQHPLSYGGMNFENNTFILPGLKKGQVVLFNFNTTETVFLKISGANIVHRVEQLDEEHFFIIDSDFYAMKTNFAKVVWKAKLDFATLHYAPSFWIKKNKAFFDSPDANYRYYFSLDLHNGDIEPVQIPLGARVGFIQKYFDDCGIDPFGNIFNFETSEITNLNIKNYL